MKAFVFRQLKPHFTQLFIESVVQEVLFCQTRPHLGRDSRWSAESTAGPRDSVVVRGYFCSVKRCLTLASEAGGGPSHRRSEGLCWSAQGNHFSTAGPNTVEQVGGCYRAAIGQHMGSKKNIWLTFPVNARGNVTSNHVFMNSTGEVIIRLPLMF